MLEIETPLAKGLKHTAEQAAAPMTATRVPDDPDLSGVATPYSTKTPGQKLQERARLTLDETLAQGSIMLQLFPDKPQEIGLEPDDSLPLEPEQRMVQMIEELERSCQAKKAQL